MRTRCVCLQAAQRSVLLLLVQSLQELVQELQEPVWELQPQEQREQQEEALHRAVLRAHGCCW